MSKHDTFDSLKVGLLEADAIVGGNMSPVMWAGLDGNIDAIGAGATAKLSLGQQVNTRPDVFSFDAATDILTIKRVGWYTFGFSISAQETVGEIGSCHFDLRDIVGAANLGTTYEAFEDAVGGLQLRSVAFPQGVFYNSVAGRTYQLQCTNSLGNILNVIGKFLTVEAISLK